MSSVVDAMVGEALSRLGNEADRWEPIIKRIAPVALDLADARIGGDHVTAVELENALQSVASSMDRRARVLAHEGFRAVIEGSLDMIIKGLAKAMT